MAASATVFRKACHWALERRLGCKNTLVLINYGPTDAKINLRTPRARSGYPAEAARRGLGPVFAVPPL